MKNFIVDNIDIKLGENAQENWDISFNSHPNFIWMHLAHYPSGHLVIQNRSPSFQTINECAKLCQQYSKCKKMRHLKYSMTTCKNLLKGDKIGEVEFISYRKVKNHPIL